VKKKMDTDVMRRLDTMPLDQAKELAKEQLTSMKRNSRFIKLSHDIDRAPTSKEVQRIIWFALLAGEGLSVTGSKWQQEHNLYS
jgi:hypothetical protein